MASSPAPPPSNSKLPAGAIDPVLLTQEALRVLSSRMETAPQDIPAGGLLRLAEGLMKLELAKLEKQPEEKGVTLTVLDLVRDTNLPDERKKELLLKERDRLEDELEQVRGELEDM